MFSDPNFDFVESWEADGPRRRWLRKYQDTLRAIAAGAGWGYVAEQLEAQGWSHFFGGPPLDGVRLAREMATIAHRSRRAGRRRQDLEATIAAAVKTALTEVAVERADLPIPVANSPAPPPPHARNVFAAAAADLAARKTGEIKIANAPTPGKRLVLDPSLQARAVAGVADDFEIPSKKTEK